MDGAETTMQALSDQINASPLLRVVDLQLASRKVMHRIYFYSSLFCSVRRRYNRNEPSKKCLGNRWFHTAVAQVIDKLHHEQEEHEKEYVCVCWASAPQSAAALRALCARAPLDVQQTTPVRVLHRPKLALTPS